MSEKKSQVSFLNFTIAINNPGFNLLSNLKTKIKVIDTRDNSVRFEGRILSNPEKMDSNGLFTKDVVAESELAYLNDSKTRKWEVHDYSVRQFLQMVIDNHNTHTDIEKQFVLGYVEVEDNLYRITDYENSLNCILDKIVNKLGGRILVRKQDGIRYLDYLEDNKNTSNNILNLGNNIQDMLLEYDTTNIITRLIPVGAEGLTIESVNDGKDYLDNANAIAQYGIIEDKFDWEDVTLANNLKTKGEAKLLEVCKATVKLEVTALDLNTLSKDVLQLGIDDNIHIKNSLMNLDDNFNVIELDTDLFQPWNSKMVIANKFASITDKVLQMQRTTNIVNNMLVEGGINSSYLQGKIDMLKNSLHAMVDIATQHKDKAILFEDNIVGSATYGARHTWLTY